MPPNNLFRKKNLAWWIRKSFEIPYLYLFPPCPSGHTSDGDYARYVGGKRVAIVGPAPSTKGSGQGRMIDGYDLVVRINHALPVPEELKPDVGTRTDILYHNMWPDHPTRPPSAELIHAYADEISFLCGAYPYTPNLRKQADTFLQLSGGRVPFRTAAFRPAVRLQISLRGYPSAGIGAINDLLYFDIAELYITGFTFYLGEELYLEDYAGTGAAAHSKAAQVRWIKQKIARDRRIRVDEVIHSLLSRENRSRSELST